MKLLIALALIAVSTAVVLHQTETRGVACNLCKDFVKDLEVELGNDEGTIEQKAEKVCDKLTHDNALLDPLCKQLVDKEIDKIVKGIENNDPPEKICKDIKFC